MGRKRPGRRIDTLHVRGCQVAAGERGGLGLVTVAIVGQAGGDAVAVAAQAMWFEYLTCAIS